MTKGTNGEELTGTTLFQRAKRGLSFKQHGGTELMWVQSPVAIPVATGFLLLMGRHAMSVSAKSSPL